MTLYGAGFGLGKMMEGVSGGMPAGTKMQYQHNLLKQKRDEAGKRREAKETQARFNRGISAVNTAFRLAQASPDPSGVFRAVQERLNPDGEMVDMTFKPPAPGSPGAEPLVSISYPGSVKVPGWKLKGAKKDVEEVLAFAQANPARSQEIIKKAVEVGLLQTKMVPFVAPKPAGGAGGGAKPVKISDYVAGIKNIYAKYRVGGGDMFITGPDGTMTLNPAGMAQGKESAYRAIQAAISKGATPEDRAEAADDLRKVKFYYGKIDEQLGTPKAQAKKPAAGSGLPSGVSEQDVQATMKKYGMTRDQVLAELRKRSGGR